MTSPPLPLLLSLPSSAVGHIALIGIGATAILDLWLMALRRAGVPTQPMAWIGRWVGHMARGRFAHVSIGQAPAVPGEAVLGWLVHYAVGVAFAALLVVIAGPGWLLAPSWEPALGVGVATVLMPWFVMQPAMGAGIAASRTAAPFQNRLRSLANHLVFGVGLLVSALALQALR
nr:DUF2938 family protein [uncultured Roseateles sp.]